MSDDNLLFNIAKGIHLLTVALTTCGFVLRGIWMLRESPLARSRPARILPHVNDTILLFSALSAAALSGQYPFVDAWLTAKVCGLLAYILLGAIALTYGPTRGIRIAALAGAFLSLGYVVAVALTKNPLPWT
jgi:uncharacterized membrane protein SirB2